MHSSILELLRVIMRKFLIIYLRLSFLKQRKTSREKKKCKEESGFV